MTERPIRNDELELTQYLLMKSKFRCSIPGMVMDLKDGNMGSIRFAPNVERKFGRELIAAKYTDSDNVPVIITVYLDSHDQLFELDFWKADFSSLKKFPKASQLFIEPSIFP
jgi:hypothetical protein